VGYNQCNNSNALNVVGNSIKIGGCNTHKATKIYAQHVIIELASYSHLFQGNCSMSDNLALI
jgi:hypothetical protein